MSADGTGVTRLTNDPAIDQDPVWSPDGSRIAFSSTRNGNYDIYVMNADGTGVTQLTTTTTDRGSTRPAWCGTRIAFESDRYITGFPDVFVMNDDGTDVTRLTITNATFDQQPAWSPTCDRIAFTQDPGGNVEIYVMNADGTGATRLTNSPGYDQDPVWSQDGSRIAFTRAADSFNREIYVMNADGTGATQLTNTIGNVWDSDPSWSFDGSEIAFRSNRDGNNEIYIMNADGTDPTRVTSDSASDGQPAWFGGSGPPPNEPPVAAFTSSCSGLTCSFTSTSSDSDGSIVAYNWTFGDSGTSTLRDPSHTYGSAGTYAVTLTVTDNQGATGSVSDTVSVSPPPPPPPLPMHVADLDGSRATAGSSWSATVAVTVQDTTQARVSGATVTGTWSLGGESSYTTDSSGACTVVIFGLQNRAKDVTFTVTGVEVVGGIYNPAANQDPDGDSDGTSITVNR